MADASSLLDFLYSDHERVASFLAQLGEPGVRKQSEEVAVKARKESQKGGLKIGPLQAGLASDQDWRKEVRLAYDPLWTNSRRLIDHIEAHSSFAGLSMIEIGQLRILRGNLVAYDLSAITSMMASEAMDDFIADGINVDQLEGRSKKFIDEYKK